MPQPPQVDVASSFRSTLEDMIVIIKDLTPECDSLEDLLGIAELALKNNGQLNLLMKRIAPLRFNPK